jgi:pyruvate/2-oxoacid:ferredoxin oxidoreductase alpha subunit
MPVVKVDVMRNAMRGARTMHETKRGGLAAMQESAGDGVIVPA